jgi:hypothetical protein
LDVVLLDRSNLQLSRRHCCDSRDPDRYADVIWAGVFGKVAVVALLVTAEMNQSGGDAPTAVLAIDVLFATGFLIFLLTRGETSVSYGESGGTD